MIEKQTVEAVTSDEFVTLKRSVVESATSFPGSSLFLARESTLVATGHVSARFLQIPEK